MGRSKKYYQKLYTQWRWKMRHKRCDKVKNPVRKAAVSTFLTLVPAVMLGLYVPSHIIADGNVVVFIGCAIWPLCWFIWYGYQLASSIGNLRLLKLKQRWAIALWAVGGLGMVLTGELFHSIRYELVIILAFFFAALLGIAGLIFVEIAFSGWYAYFRNKP